MDAKNKKAKFLNFGGKAYGHLRLVKQRQLLKESIKTKTESGKCFCFHAVLSIKLKLIVMSTNLQYRARERQKSGRPAKLNEKKGDRDLERDKKQRRNFFVGRTT